MAAGDTSGQGEAADDPRARPGTGGGEVGDGTATGGGAGRGGQGTAGASGFGWPLAPEALTDLIRVVNAPGHEAWAGQVRRIGGCAHPLHMAGYTRRIDARTGLVLGEYTSSGRPGGVVLVACRNRRVIACPACASVYHGDTFHLVRAGLLGGKGVPETVSAHPRIFLTLSAPGFGAVHTTRTGPDGRGLACHPRRTGGCQHGNATACWQRHGDDDPVLGAPLCPDCYDYPAAVIWQGSIGTLWRRFTTYLPRHLARAAGLTHRELRRQVRVSYVKIVEYQRRGLVHVHAVIRADGLPDDTADDTADDGQERGQGRGTVVVPPGWVSGGLLEEAARSAAAAVRVRGPRYGDERSPGWLTWGEQTDVQDITAPTVTGSQASQDGGDGPRTGRRIALYVAKYATKGTEVTGWTGRSLDDTPRAVHAERMVLTALNLAPVPELAGLNLGRWARHLAYRGHVASKSRRYSTTMGALRAARAEHTRARAGGPPVAGEQASGDAAGVWVESSWRLVGHGYTPGQAVVAAEVARDAAVNRAASRDAGAASRVGGRAHTR